MKKLIIGCLVFIFGATAHADWKYDESTEKMSGKTQKNAVIESNNSLSLGFPYAGLNHGTLIVRQHPGYGLDVILQVQKGQILCSSYGGCPIQVKFDDAAPMRFGGSPSADHDSTTIFFDGNNKFISNALKAKKILVQVNMYQAGAPILEFSTTESLKWEINKGNKKR